MKIYKNTINELWAFEEDDSQNHLIPDDFILITEEEATAIRAEKIAEYNRLNPVVKPTKEQLLAELQKLTAKIEALGND